MEPVQAPSLRQSLQMAHTLCTSWTARLPRPLPKGSTAKRAVSSWKGKGAVTVGVADNLSGRLSAVGIVKDAVARLGGRGGGGRDDFARGGGREIAERIASDRSEVATILGKLGQEIGVGR